MIPIKVKDPRTIMNLMGVFFIERVRLSPYSSYELNAFQWVLGHINIALTIIGDSLTVFSFCLRQFWVKQKIE
jgi:hypothetical protein